MEHGGGSGPVGIVLMPEGEGRGGKGEGGEGEGHV